MQFQSRPENWPLLTIESPVAQWLEHPTRSRGVVGSNPIWDSDFFPNLILCFLDLHENGRHQTVYARLLQKSRCEIQAQRKENIHYSENLSEKRMN